MNDLSFSSSFPTLLCDIYQKAHSPKVFLCRKTPPPPSNSPLVHIKSKWKKEWHQWGKWGLMEGDDIYIYVTVNMCNQGICVFPEIFSEYAYSPNYFFNLTHLFDHCRMGDFSKSIADIQFFSNNSFTYFWESFYLVRFQTRS